MMDLNSGKAAFTLTSNPECHYFLCQDFYIIPVDSAGVDTLVIQLDVFQGQTQVTSSQCIFIHLCPALINLVLLVLTILGFVDQQVYGT